jgi:hypothetical protein
MIMMVLGHDHDDDAAAGAPLHRSTDETTLGSTPSDSRNDPEPNTHLNSFAIRL